MDIILFVALTFLGLVRKEVFTWGSSNKVSYGGNWANGTSCGNVQVCEHCKGDYTLAVGSGDVPEQVCLLNKSQQYGSVHWNNGLTNTGSCLYFDDLNNVDYADTPGRWQAWSTCSTDCLRFSLAKHFDSMVDFNYTTISPRTKGECFKACFNDPTCFTFSYNSYSDTCYKYECGDSCIITHGTSTIYTRTCHECTLVTNTSSYTVYLPEGRSPQATMYLSCNFGYSLTNGNLTRQCQAHLTWSGSPAVCSVEGCGPPIEVENATIVSLTNGTAYGSVASYACDGGFVLIGDNQGTCQNNGHWTFPIPDCTLIDCGEPPVIQHATYSFTFGTFLGSVATLVCDPGYIMSEIVSQSGINNGDKEDSNLICVNRAIGGVWSGLIQSCTVVNCGIPALIAGCNVTYSETTYGSIANVSCSSDSNIHTNYMIECNVTGQWSSTNISRLPLLCKDLEPPENGFVNVTGYSANAIALFGCSVGYVLIGEGNMTCNETLDWSLEEPICELVDCGTPPSPLNGSVNIPEGTTYLKEAEYICDNGYDLEGPLTRQCQANGNWDSSEPYCEIEDCGEPPILENTEIRLLNGSTFLDSLAQYVCKDGYIGTGEDVVNCKNNKRWSDPLLVCNIVDCGPLEPPDYGSVSTPGGTTVDKIATFSCDSGYVLTGDNARFCTLDGSWNFTTPICLARDTETKTPTKAMTTTSTLTSVIIIITATAMTTAPTMTSVSTMTTTPAMTTIHSAATAVSTSTPRKQRFVKRLYIMPCLCNKGSFFFAGMTEKEIITYLEKETAIETKNTSAYIYKRRCREDNRPFTTTTGIVAGCVMAAIFGVILAADLGQLLRHVRNYGTLFKGSAVNQRQRK